ncbi:MAG: hypothetical protein MJZ22_04765 [Candidatus Saccharibacteria bacterium]|nr:hypothetical protein [Candidatus Saccharibacteria bacterium]
MTNAGNINFTLVQYNPYWNAVFLACFSIRGRVADTYFSMRTDSLQNRLQLVTGTFINRTITTYNDFEEEGLIYTGKYGSCTEILEHDGSSKANQTSIQLMNF